MAGLPLREWGDTAHPTARGQLHQDEIERTVLPQRWAGAVPFDVAVELLAVEAQRRAHAAARRHDGAVVGRA